MRNTSTEAAASELSTQPAAQARVLIPYSSANGAPRQGMMGQITGRCGDLRELTFHDGARVSFVKCEIEEASI